MYEPYYFRKAGLSGPFTYDHITLLKGAPNKEELIPGDVPLVKLYYDFYTLQFIGTKNGEKPNYMMGYVVIKDKDYRLGQYDIRVGSTKKEVEKAYKKCMKIKDVPAGYIDNNKWVEFTFNEFDEVTEIKVSIGP